MIIEYSVVKRDFSGIMKLAGNEVVSLPCYKREESGKDSAKIIRHDRVTALLCRFDIIY